MTAVEIIRAPAAGGFADRVRSAVVWRWGSQVLAQMITWAATILVVRLLDPTDYGHYAMAQAVLAAFTFLNGYSFATSLIQAREVDKRRIGQVFGMLIVANGTLATLQFLAAPLAAEYYNQPLVAEMLRIQALIFFTTPFIALPSALLSRTLHFRNQALVNLVCAVAGGGTALTLALGGYGVWALVWAPVVMFATRAAGLTIAARTLVRPIFDFRGCRDILTFGGALTLSQLFWVIQSQSDIFIAGRSFDVHELGLYSEALFVALIFTGRFVPPLNDVAFPAFAELVKEGKPIGGAFLSGVQTVMLIALPAYVGLSLTAEPLVSTVFGPKWVEMAPILAGLALAMPAMALQIICSPATNALGRPGVYLFTNAAGAVIMPLCFLLGVRFGPQGLVASWQFAAPLLLMVTLAVTLPKVGVRVSELGAVLLPSVVGTGAMALVVSLLGTRTGFLPAPTQLPLLIMCGGIVYVATLTALWPEVVRRVWSMAVRRQQRDDMPLPKSSSTRTRGQRAKAFLELALRPRFAVPAVALITSIAELAIADRKYGVFSGGFGQAQAVDTIGERLVFLAGYGLSQTALVLVAWSACTWASRASGRSAAVLNFAFVYGGAMLGILVARYQLHSYFSDAMDFALLKNLGGGSLADALLFGMNEIALGLAVAAGLACGWWLAVRVLRQVIAIDSLAPPPPLRAVLATSALWLAALAIVPNLSEDAARGLNRTVGWGTASGLAAALTDFDRDGYGLVGLQIDRQPFDATRHPLALDIPSNGIDEDGYGGDLILVPVPQPRPEAIVPTIGPNVVLVVMESTRGEAIGKRIDGKLVAPNLTSLAAEGTGISSSYSHVGFTTASLKSIFAGDLSPSVGAPSLFTELKKSGYGISVISGQPEDFGDISETVGMRTHADRFIDAEMLRDKRAFSFAAQGSLLVDEAVLLGEFDRVLGHPDAWNDPQFVYLNFQSPHFPYHHPGIPHRFANPPVTRAQIDASRQTEVERTYWNAVAHADAALGEVIARLKALGQWDNTILLVTGDHGESLFEDGFLGHGHVINERQFATFFAINRPLSGISGPIAVSDYRGILLDLLQNRRPSPVTHPPFMHVGDLDRPSTIGLAGTEFGIVSLRLDRGDVCFERPARCASYSRLTERERDAADAIVARWGSERWVRQSPRKP